MYEKGHKLLTLALLEAWGVFEKFMLQVTWQRGVDFSHPRVELGPKFFAIGVNSRIFTDLVVHENFFGLLSHESLAQDAGPLHSEPDIRTANAILTCMFQVQTYMNIYYWW